MQITYHFWLNRNYSAILAILHYLQGSENGLVVTIDGCRVARMAE
jgi:hypothetical protein